MSYVNIINKMNIFYIDEIIISIYNQLTTQGQIKLSYISTYLNNFVKMNHQKNKVVYIWDIPVEKDDYYFRSIDHFYIYNQFKNNILSIHSQTFIKSDFNVPNTIINELIEYKDEKDTKSFRYKPIQNGIIAYTNDLYLIEFQPHFTIKKLDINIDKHLHNYHYENDTLFFIDNNINYLSKNGVKTVKIDRIFGIIIPYKNKYIIKNYEYYYIINKDCENLIEYKIEIKSKSNKPHFNYYHDIVDDFIIGTDAKKFIMPM